MPIRRAQLAAALAETAKAKQEFAQQRQAVDRLFAETAEAERAIAKAQKALAKAEEAHVAGLADAAAAGKRAPASGVAAARQAVAAAVEHRDALRAARIKVEQRLPDGSRTASTQRSK